MDSFTGLNAQVLGISIDHIACLKAWAESLGGINYPLLSDFWPHGALAELYGVFRPDDGHSERAIFVIDKDGIIRYIDIHNIDDRPDNEVLRQVLRDLEGIPTAEAPVNEQPPAGQPEGEKQEPEQPAAKTPSPKPENKPANASVLISPGIYFDLDEEDETIPDSEIVLYCARWCKDCKKAKAWLDERGLKYVEVDVDSNMAARTQVRQWGNGFLVTPVIDIAGTIVLDFDVPRLEEALRKYKS